MFTVLESFRSALHSIRANALRSILTSLGIIIGTAAIIAVVSLVQGLQASITRQFEGLGANSVYITPTRGEFGLFTSKLTEQDRIAIETLVPGLSFVSPLVIITGKVFYNGEDTQPTQMIGVDENYAQLGDQFPSVGRYINAVDNRSRSRIMVIGEQVRQDLELPANPVGEFVRLNQEWFRIVGLLETKGSLLGQNQDNVVYIPYNTAIQLSGKAVQPDLVLVTQLQDAAEMDSIQQRMRSILRKQHGLRPADADDFLIQSADQILNSISQITGIITLVFGGIVGVSLLVGGIGIMNIMLVSVTERTREIGICKALGAKRADILLQFLIEAVVLSLMGGLIGLACGYGLGEVIARMIPGFGSAYVPIWAVLLGLGFSTGTGVIFGLLPAAKASRLDPIEALRYE